MKISQDFRDGWCVVSPQGRADATNSNDLEAALVAAASGHPRVALDLAELGYISSAGLRAVLQGARAAQKHGAEFVVCSAAPGVQKVFEISGLDRLIRMEGALPC
jgi:anti-sigma B factor antagonist